MRYTVLLRGINVGGKNTVNMKRLQSALEDKGYTNVSTYINSGNIFLESLNKRATIESQIHACISTLFGCDIPVLVKTHQEIQAIAKAIPDHWKNNEEQKTDIAYLFPEYDTPEIIESLPIRKEYISVRYTLGAVIWNLQKEHYNKSNLSLLSKSPLYKAMTIRNVNTARKLSSL